MTLADELEKLQHLHERGALSDEEFAKAKDAVLNSPVPPQAVAALASKDQQAKQWAMLLHMSQLAGFLLPLAGLVAPIVIWQLKKDELPEIDVHGKIVLNWIISEIIYVALCVILILALIGIPLLIALAIIAIIFPIVGGIKANNGEVWKYPLSITFLK